MVENKGLVTQTQATDWRQGSVDPLFECRESLLNRPDIEVNQWDIFKPLLSITIA